MKNICESKRLLLRTWTLEDASDALEIWGNSEVMKFVDPEGVCPNVEKALVMLSRAIAYQDENGFCRWAIEEKDTRKIVGSCGFFRLSNGELDIGYYVKPKYWRRGFAQEAVEVSLQYGFEILALEKIWASVIPENKASIALLRKLKFEDLGLKPADSDPSVLDHWFVKSFT